MQRDVVWLADWSDEEDAAWRRAWGSAPPQVLRTVPLGRTVGSRLHRLRSWPAYAALAVRGLRSCPRGGVLVAWQPLAGALVALAPRRRSGLVVLNPLLRSGDRSARARLLARGLRRADRVVLFSAAALPDARAVGIDPARLVVVELGTDPRPAPAPSPEAPLLAAGRDHRDWSLLAQAARAAGQHVLVAGPTSVPAPLEAVHPRDHAAFLQLLTTVRAVVVPLLDDTRQAGTLAVLDALSAGRPVVATRGPGTQGYLPADAGRLVEPGDLNGLTAGLAASSDPATLAAWAAGARRAAGRRTLAATAAGLARIAAEVRAERRHDYPG